MSFTGTLLPYQPEAVDKMCERGSMLVAYDLGLGKTVLTIAAIERLMDEGRIREPGLIICLSSLKYQWASQIEKFTNGSVPLVIDGSPSKRAEQYQLAKDWKESKVDYIILNYEQVVNDWNYVSKLPRGFVVLDEATAIKSFRSKRSKSVKKLGTATFRFALTGTPIENGRPEELYSILQFVDQTILGKFDVFDNKYIIRNSWGQVSGYKNLPDLTKRVSTVCIRKSQSDPDVSPFLPDTIHKDPIFVPFDRAAAKVYRKIVDDLKYDLETAQSMMGSNFDVFSYYGMADSGNSGFGEIQGEIMSKLMCLRMLCSHPDLLKSSADNFYKNNGEGSAYAFKLGLDGFLTNLNHAPKLDYLTKYAKDFLDNDSNNKIVIFASYLDMGPKIAEAIGESKCVIYSGRLNAKAKEANKNAFNENPAIRVFISSDAGGYGVDLPAANLLINYDLPWSSGAATQRNGRIRRASSKWPSIVIQDILMLNSVEVRQYEMLQQKNSVASAVIEGKGIDATGGMKLTLGSLNRFLDSSNV
jgi:SNF2 family DNA or RNA helicase